MSLTTQFRSWHVQGHAGASGTLGVSAGIFRYRMTAADPVLGSGTTRVPGYRDARTATVRYQRVSVPGSTAPEVARSPRVIAAYSSPRLRTSFDLTFTGVGTGPGIPLGYSYSEPSHPSATGILAFMGPSRSGEDFLGSGVVLEATGTVGIPLATWGLQILLLNAPPDMFSGVGELLRRVERALASRQGTSQDWHRVLHGLVRPHTSIVVVVGWGSGAAAGLTAYYGLFGVT
jgi:hypothetical protein